MSVETVVTFAAPGAPNGAVAWSDDMKIAIATENALQILVVQCNPSEPQTRVAVCREKIFSEEEVNEFDAGFKRDVLQTQLNRHELYSLVVDRILSPAIQTQKSWRGYKQAAWSPLGGDTVGRSLMATLTLDHRLCLYKKEKACRHWKKLVELSSKYHSFMEADGYSIGKSMNDKNSTENTDLHTWRNIVYSLAAVTIAWSPVYTTTLSNAEYSGTDPLLKMKLDSGAAETAEKSRFAFLFVGMRSGHVVIWKIDFPYVDSSSCHVFKILECGRAVPGVLRWCHISHKEGGFLVIGDRQGVVKAYRIDRTGEEEHLTVHTQHQLLWPDRDNLVPVNVLWRPQENLLIASKGTFLVALKLATCGATIKVKKSNHYALNQALPILGLSDHGQRMLVLTGHGDLFSAAITDEKGKADLTIEVTEVVPTSKDFRCQCYGHAMSPNQVFGLMLNSPVDHHTRLGMKEPLQAKIWPNMSTEEVEGIIQTNQGTEGMTSIRDALVYIQCLLAQGQDLPPFLDKLVTDQQTWTQLSPYWLKVLRFLLQTKASISSQKGEMKESLSRDVLTIENLIVVRAVARTLQHYRDATIETFTLSEKEKLSVHLKCRWLMSTEKAFQLLVGAVQQKLLINESDASLVEKCMVCQENLEITSTKYGTCSKNHSFARCGHTLLLCQYLPCRQCSLCHTPALGSHQLKDWHHIPGEYGLCLFCDGVLV